ncbi:MAG: hypothetical protein S4CHLAM81_01980 [Chlamydiales bacterium]|nr:hypothetical protein [Chlamydiales bacterium]MCH9634992.1 hypothetical protein [Chlamydiales bacterium]
MLKFIEKKKKKKQQEALFVASKPTHSFDPGSCLFIPNLFCKERLVRLAKSHANVLLFGEPQFTTPAQNWLPTAKAITSIEDLYDRELDFNFDLIVVLTRTKNYLPFLRALIHVREYRKCIATPGKVEWSMKIEDIEPKEPIFLCAYPCAGTNRLMFGFRHLMNSIQWEQKPHIELSHNARLIKNRFSWSESDEVQRWHLYSLDYCQWLISHLWFDLEKLQSSDSKIVILMRDPRDILNSLFWRSDNCDILEFINGHDISTHINYTAKLPSAKEICNTYLRALEMKNSVIIRFEDMHNCDLEALKGLMSDLKLFPHPFGMSEEGFVKAAFLGSFQYQNGGKRSHDSTKIRGQMNVSCRKGSVGDWRSSFTKEACDLFKEQTGDALIQLGYETSMDWSS